MMWCGMNRSGQEEAEAAARVCEYQTHWDYPQGFEMVCPPLPVFYIVSQAQNPRQAHQKHNLKKKQDPYKASEVPVSAFHGLYCVPSTWPT